MKFAEITSLRQPSLDGICQTMHESACRTNGSTSHIPRSSQWAGPDCCSAPPWPAQTCDASDFAELYLTMRDGFGFMQQAGICVWATRAIRHERKELGCGPLTDGQRLGPMPVGERLLVVRAVPRDRLADGWELLRHASGMGSAGCDQRSADSQVDSQRRQTCRHSRARRCTVSPGRNYRSPGRSVALVAWHARGQGFESP